MGHASIPHLLENKGQNLDLRVLSSLLGKSNMLLVDAVGLLLRAHVVLDVTGERVLLLDIMKNNRADKSCSANGSHGGSSRE